MDQFMEWMFKNVFSEIVQIERSLEESRVSLAESADFNLEQAF